ncbi:MAG: hypothetical protein A3K19_25340 [Lentisphaerae bacterium RIFOXYB12_FULL_65_16]|nr:MAG: hypothetical protein A3K18_26390 [Lentisphaerae bacterium RIFOXYA12_64_32]OGV87640.1 MAG: hypothetical protein A3K19_25340 [Lentisphaerae bacterium RIFOXYB12_FULL_65_16]
MDSRNIRIASNQRFGCIQCGQCCRRFYVALSESDIRRLRSLNWSRNDDIPADPVVTVRGHPFLAHQASGDCIYLDAQTNRCRIHGRFGAPSKPLACRGYPLNIASCGAGGVSVTARMDCPAVQQNHGPLLTQGRREIEKFVAQLGTRGGSTTDESNDGLAPEAVTAVMGALAGDLLKKPGLPPGRRSAALLVAVERFAELGPDFLNDIPTLQEVIPSFTARTIEKAESPPKSNVGMFSRALFSQWLGSYLRRDEEMLNQGAIARVKRSLNLAKMVVGHGSLADLGGEHPSIPLRKVRLFSPPPPASSAPDPTPAWECYWRLLESRFETLQFYGPTYFELPFFVGLRALVMTYPLVLAAARCHAADRHAATLGEEDVRYAVGAIDHSFGRSRLLQIPLWRSVEIYFSGSRYPRLLASLGGM